jgi:hypothetical protein
VSESEEEYWHERLHLNIKEVADGTYEFVYRYRELDDVLDRTCEGFAERVARGDERDALYYARSAFVWRDKWMEHSRNATPAGNHNRPSLSKSVDDLGGTQGGSPSLPHAPAGRFLYATGNHHATRSIGSRRTRPAASSSLRSR